MIAIHSLFTRQAGVAVGGRGQSIKMGKAEYIDLPH